MVNDELCIAEFGFKCVGDANDRTIRFRQPYDTERLIKVIKILSIV